LKRTQAVGLAVAGVIVAATAAGIYVVRRSPRYMSPASPAYEAVSRAFYHGLAALQVGLLDDARTQFASATAIVPREPASWGNLGLTDLRLGDLDGAGPALERAASLAPASADIAFLQGQLEISRGRPAEAIAHFERGVRLDPRGLRIRYALAQEVEAAGGAGADTRAQGLVDEILAPSPGNVAAILERARLAAKRGDATALQDAVAKLSAPANSWPPAVLDQYRALQAAARTDAAEAARTVAVLRNVLLRVPSFREDLLAIRTPAELIADPFDRFIALPASNSRPSPPDTSLSFSTELLGVQQGALPVAALAFSSEGTGAPIVYAANNAGLSRVSGTAAVLPFPGGSNSPQTLGSAALSIDWNRDFRMDLVLAGTGGIRLLRQGADGTFRDATAAAAGTDQAVTADCVGAWTADIEMDGDLDVVVGEKSGPVIVLRNNGDGTWRQTRPFAGVSDLRGFGWADVDGDGDPDAVLLDAQGNLHVFENRQGGQFAALADPRSAKGLVSVAVADVNGDGLIDIVTLDGQGSVRRASFVRDAWDEHDLARWDNPPAFVTPGAAPADRGCR
jgi:Tfp pilus assembly protein PilF